MGFFDDSPNGNVVDVVAFMDSDIPRHIGDLVSMGYLVAVGTTRDRGAVSIQITSDGQWKREYFRTSSEASEWLQHAARALRGSGIGVTEQQPAAIQKPRRPRSKAL